MGNDFLRELADKHNLTKKQMLFIMEDYFATCEQALLDNGQLTLPGLGKLKIKQMAARDGRNPQTGEALRIPARRKVIFAAGKALNEALNPPKKREKK